MLSFVGSRFFPSHLAYDEQIHGKKKDHNGCTLPKTTRVSIARKLCFVNKRNVVSKATIDNEKSFSLIHLLPFEHIPNICVDGPIHDREKFLQYHTLICIFVNILLKLCDLHDWIYFERKE